MTKLVDEKKENMKNDNILTDPDRKFLEVIDVDKDYIDKYFEELYKEKKEE